jgi:outer membrane protein assembly factor BamB
VTTEGAIVSSPALGEEGRVYFTSVDGRLYALHADGSEHWRYWTGTIRESSPVLDPQENIYLGVSNMFVAVAADGTRRKWDFGYPVVDGCAAISLDGRIYFGTDNGVLCEWTPEGTLRTFTNLGGRITASPTITPDGTLIIGVGNAKVHALKVSARLGGGPWPKFRGNLQQNGRAR